MSNDIFVLVEHRDGAVAESAYELLGRARELATASGGAAVALVAGAAASSLASQLGAAGRVIAVEDASLAEFTPAAWQAALADRKSTRLNSSHLGRSRMPSSA